MRLLSCVAAFAVGTLGCDYHETFRPLTAHVADAHNESARVRASLVSVGYDATTLAVTIEVTNEGADALLFTPSEARLVFAEGQNPDLVLKPLTASMGGGAFLDGALMTGINEAVRGPYASRASELARGARRRYTLQFSVKIEDDYVFPVGRPLVVASLRSGCALHLHSAFVTERGAHVSAEPSALAVEIVDRNEPEFGFAPPESAGAVFVLRLGAGPGFGPTAGVGGLELAAGPRWGQTAMTFSATLGYGFPLAIEASHRWLQTSAIHSSVGVGPVVWFFPSKDDVRGGPTFGPRASIDLVYDAGTKVFGHRSRTWGAGLYARGGPIVHRARIGGELELGIEVGAF